MFKRILAMALLAITLTVSTAPLWAATSSADSYTTEYRRGSTGGHGGGHRGGHF
jgi:hypothetical protein